MSQRAIVYFQEQSCRDDTTVEALHYYCRAVQALEKQVPKLVNHDKGFWRYRHFCPNCSEEFTKENLAYCDKCGQKLDWSNYWEALK